MFSTLDIVQAFSSRHGLFAVRLIFSYLVRLYTASIWKMKIQIDHWSVRSFFRWKLWILFLKSLKEETQVPVVLPLDSWAKTFSVSCYFIFIVSKYTMVINCFHLQLSTQCQFFKLLIQYVFFISSVSKNIISCSYSDVFRNLHYLRSDENFIRMASTRASEKRWAEPCPAQNPGSAATAENPQW